MQDAGCRMQGAGYIVQDHDSRRTEEKNGLNNFLK